MDIEQQIDSLQKSYSDKHGHRLEIYLCSDMDRWTCEFGIEAWAAVIAEGQGNTPMEAFNAAWRNWQEKI